MCEKITLNVDNTLTRKVFMKKSERLEEDRVYDIMSMLEGGNWCLAAR